MPRQLSQVQRFPFFGSLRKKSVRTSAEVCKTAFSIQSTWILSTPQAFPFFKTLLAILASSLLGGLVSMSKGAPVVSMSARSFGSGLALFCGILRGSIPPSVLLACVQF